MTENAIGELLEAFRQMKTAQDAVCAGVLQDSALCAWMHQPEYPIDHRTHAVEVIQQIEYSEDQDPKAVFVAPGLIGASTQTLMAVETLNACKQAFKEAIKQVKLAKIKLHDERLLKPIEQLLNTRTKHVSQALSRVGLGRLNLKQCYRKLPILKQCPKKVSWTWANTRSIKKITRDEAEGLLRKKNEDDGILGQLRRLAALPPKEPLAIVQDLAPHLRANILYPVDRAMVKGPMPLFFPADVNTHLPAFKPPKIKQSKDENRLIRSDTKLEPEPYLSAIRAHRYKTVEPVED